MSTKATQSFDPYHRWLGIPPRDQPPHHYRLLGLDVFEGDADVIESAADRQMKHVRSFQTGQHSRLSQRVLNELAAAKICLLNPDKKAAYDAELRVRMSAEQNAPTGSRTVAHAQSPLAASPTPLPAVPPTLQAAPPPPRPVIDQPTLPQPSWPASTAWTAPGPSVAVKPKRQLLGVNTNRPSWSQPTILLIAAGVIGLTLLLAAGIVLWLATDQGEIVIESTEPGVEVLVKQGDKVVETIETEVAQKNVTIRSGSYAIELKGTNADTFEIDNQQVTLKRGDKVVVNVTRRTKVAANHQQPKPSPVKIANNKPESSNSLPEDKPKAASQTANTNNAPADVATPPTKAAEVGAVVEVAGMTMTPFANSAELPVSPSSALTSAWITKPKGADIKLGLLRFEVKQDGVVYLVTNTEYQGNKSGGWWEERVTKENLVEQGWEDLGPCPWKPKETMLKRMVAAGESYRIRTNKYGPPQLVVPGPVRNQIANTAVVSPPPSLEPRMGQHFLRLGEMGGIELADTKGMIRPGQPGTIEFWARLNPEAKALNLVGDRVLGGNYPELGGQQGGFMVRCNKRDATTATADIMFRSGGGTRQFQVRANEWQHFAVCSDMERIQFFVDGKLVADRKSDPEDWRPAPLNIHFGFHRFLFFSVRQGFNGDLQAVRVSSSCRYRDAFTTPSELKKDADTTVLLDFSNPQGERIEDLSGSGHHGTITGGQWIAIEQE